MGGVTLLYGRQAGDWLARSGPSEARLQGVILHLDTLIMLGIGDVWMHLNGAMGEVEALELDDEACGDGGLGLGHSASASFSSPDLIAAPTRDTDGLSKLVGLAITSPRILELRPQAGGAEFTQEKSSEPKLAWLPLVNLPGDALVASHAARLNIEVQRPIPCPGEPPIAASHRGDVRLAAGACSRAGVIRRRRRDDWIVVVTLGVHLITLLCSIRGSVSARGPSSAVSGTDCQLAMVPRSAGAAEC